MLDWGDCLMDLLICNVKLLDVNTGLEHTADVAVNTGRIAQVFSAGNGNRDGARSLIDAHGDYLFPGFIDFHTHLFAHGSTFGMDADRLLTAGVTFAVDMGTSGWVNYPALYNCDLATKIIGHRAYLNLSPVGQPGKGINEPLGREIIDAGKMEELIARYPGQIAGIKVRISRSIVGKLGLEPLRLGIKIGERLGLPVCVHTTDPPASASDVADLLRPGDIYSHMYHGTGNTILDAKGKVQERVRLAQQRGVIMELGNGRVNFNFPVAEQAVACGFWPDILSSDSTQATFHREKAMWDLPTVMSKFLYLGMPLEKVLRAVTETPAACLGLADRIGKVQEGYDADLVLCHFKREPVEFLDSDGNFRTGEWKIIPKVTLLKGQVVYQASSL